MAIITTYKGVTKIIQQSLFEPIVEVKNPPRKSNKFGEISLYYNGVYYFIKDLKHSKVREGKPFEIQGVFYRGKWRQDTFYITEKLKNLLIQYS